MNADFRLSVHIFTHPKFIMLGRKLGSDGQLCLLRFFGYVSVNRPDGDLSGIDADTLELAAGFGGEEGLFLSTLIKLKWLDVAPDGAMSVHDWTEHNPWAAGAKIRSDKARKGAAVRWGKEINATSIDSDAISMNEHCSKQGSHNQAMPLSISSPSPLPTSPNLTTPYPLASTTPESVASGQAVVVVGNADAGEGFGGGEEGGAGGASREQAGETPSAGSAGMVGGERQATDTGESNPSRQEKPIAPNGGSDSGNADSNSPPASAAPAPPPKPTSYANARAFVEGELKLHPHLTAELEAACIGVTYERGEWNYKKGVMVRLLKEQADRSKNGETCNGNGTNERGTAAVGSGREAGTRGSGGGGGVPAGTLTSIELIERREAEDFERWKRTSGWDAANHLPTPSGPPN